MSLPSPLSQSPYIRQLQRGAQPPREAPSTLWRKPWVVSVESYDWLVLGDVYDIYRPQIILIFDILMVEISYPAS
jgi:hypothetical protein